MRTSTLLLTGLGVAALGLVYYERVLAGALVGPGTPSNRGATPPPQPQGGVARQAPQSSAFAPNPNTGFLPGSGFNFQTQPFDPFANLRKA